MIVEIDQVKALLGIDLDDTSEDAHIEQLILAATEWFQGEVKKRFDVPIEHEEFREGNNERLMYLHGHIDRTQPPAGQSAEPETSLVVSYRWLGSLDPWTLLVEGEDYEERRDIVVGATGFFAPWAYTWNRAFEFKFEYLNGYWVAPDDVQQVILELVTGQYMADVDRAAGTAGVTSEKIGDYSYNVDLGAAAGSSVGISSGTLSANARRTIERYRRMRI